ncbi:MAG: oligosaccharide flippase family protein [Phycisphaerales bacterium]|nr:oligosaccharide flippase family protein [Phycisphaerales bacterium]MCB9835944.1 oligosaccharide flippase family protein [Phycisphaera sp.]
MSDLQAGNGSTDGTDAMNPGDQGASGTGGASLTRTAARGVAWTSAVSLAERISAFGIQFLLAALLSLETWGAWGIITSVVMLFTGFASTGVREVLIHRSSSYRLWSGPALWFALVWGLALSLLTAAVAWPVSLMVKPEYATETLLGLLVVAPTPLMQSLFSVPRAKLAIDHRFKEAALIYALPGIGQLVLTLVLAWMGMRIMAFAIPYTLAMLVRTVLMMRAARVWLSGPLRVSRWKYFTGDARRVWVESTAVWMRGQADVLIVGLFATQAEVGLYTFARNMSRQMVTLFTQQVAGVIQPMLVTMQADPKRLLSAFMRSSRLLAFMGVPMTIGIAAVMWPGTSLVMDEEKWAELPLVLTAMSVGIALRVLTESAVSLKFAIGRFREQQVFSVVSSVFFCLCVGLGAWQGGVLGASIGFAVFCAGAGPLQFLTAVQPVGGGWKETSQAVFMPMIWSLIAIAPWTILSEVIGHRTKAWQAVEVIMVVACSALTYLLLAIALRMPELAELAERVRDQSPGRLRPFVDRLTAPMMVRKGRSA